jgi:F-type H+-transporting ATPase subunit gamma
MASMRDIKTKIRSVENTRKITNAMKMVAASKLRRAQEQAQVARPYADKMHEVIVSLAAGSQGASHPMLVSRPVRKTGYLVLTSDRGLAGGYNGNLLRLLLQLLKERHRSKEEYLVFVVGRKGLDFLKRRKIPVVDQVTDLSDTPQFADVKPVASEAVNYYAEGKYDALYLLYNEFVNPVIQHPLEKRLLPLTEDAFAETTTAATTSYEYEPSQAEVLAQILPRYAETLIYSALLNGKASEHAARMNAMANATDNAGEMIERLKLQFNRARQAAITQEIAEIVGGAAAL